MLREILEKYPEVPRGYKHFDNIRHIAELRQFLLSLSDEISFDENDLVHIEDRRDYIQMKLYSAGAPRSVIDYINYVYNFGLEDDEKKYKNTRYGLPRI